MNVLTTERSPNFIYLYLKRRSHIHSTLITESAIARIGRPDLIKWSGVVN
ncbi:MAG: hypothetical protein RID53_33385 [Coleofasciculus sp. B1-GNL1-01]